MSLHIGASRPPRREHVFCTSHEPTVACSLTVAGSQGSHSCELQPGQEGAWPERLERSGGWGWECPQPRRQWHLPTKCNSSPQVVSYTHCLPAPLLIASSPCLLDYMPPHLPSPITRMYHMHMQRVLPCLPPIRPREHLFP